MNKQTYKTDNLYKQINIPQSDVTQAQVQKQEYGTLQSFAAPTLPIIGVGSLMAFDKAFDTKQTFQEPATPRPFAGGGFVPSGGGGGDDRKRGGRFGKAWLKRNPFNTDMLSEIFGKAKKKRRRKK